LRGLETLRCPECGREFDTDEPLTMNLGRPLDRLAITLLRPLGRWAPVTMWSLAAAGVVGPAWMTPSRLLACLWLLLWGAFTFLCWWRSFLRYLVVLRYRQPRECLRIDDPFRWRTRRVFAIVTFLVLTNAPFHLFSRPWLDRDANYIWAVLPSDVEPRQGPRVQGLVIVQRVSAGPTHVTYELFGGGRVTYTPTPDGQRVAVTWSLLMWEW
jgi:hypothetical protein